MDKATTDSTNEIIKDGLERLSIENTFNDIDYYHGLNEAIKRTIHDVIQGSYILEVLQNRLMYVLKTVNQWFTSANRNSFFRETLKLWVL